MVKCFTVLPSCTCAYVLRWSSSSGSTWPLNGFWLSEWFGFNLKTDSPSVTRSVLYDWLEPRIWSFHFFNRAIFLISIVQGLCLWLCKQFHLVCVISGSSICHWVFEFSVDTRWCTVHGCNMTMLLSGKQSLQLCIMTATSQIMFFLASITNVHVMK